jgi:hypothetical protein
MANITTQMTATIPAGSQMMVDLFKSAILDLSGGSKNCQIPFAVPTLMEGEAKEGVYDCGYSMMDSEMLISLLTYGAIDELQQASGKTLDFPVPKYAYDCDTAVLMGMYSAFTRGQQSFDGKGYIITVNDAYNILSRCSMFQEQVNITLEQTGYGGPFSGNNAIPLLQDDYCRLVKPTSPCGSDVVVIDGENLPPVGGIGVDLVSDKEKEAGWPLWVAAAAAVGVAGYGVIHLMKKGRTGR